MKFIVKVIKENFVLKESSKAKKSYTFLAQKTSLFSRENLGTFKESSKENLGFL